MSENIITIAFIGAGNMATALIQGLIANGISNANIWASDPDAEKLAQISTETGINTDTDNIAAIRLADVVVLAVKPQVMAAVLAPLKESISKRQPLLLSIAAGIDINALQSWTSSEQAIVRCMPNTPALVQAGASALYANDNTTAEQRLLAESILTAVGSVCWLNQEAEIDAVTALSGSGPAYFFLLIEAMQETAIRLGLSTETARSLSLQTAAGAAKLALASDLGVDELRRNVTSPGGTTEAALKQFADDGFKQMVDRALNKARERSQELAEILGKS